MGKIKQAARGSESEDAEIVVEKKAETKKSRKGKKQVEEKKKGFLWLVWLMAVIIIAAFVTLGIYYKTYALNIIKIIKDFLFVYYAYIIAGIIVLFVLIAIVNSIRKDED